MPRRIVTLATASIRTEQMGRVPLGPLQWIAFREGDEEHGVRAFGSTPEEARESLQSEFPDDGAQEKVLS